MRRNQTLISLQLLKSYNWISLHSSHVHCRTSCLLSVAALACLTGSFATAGDGVTANLLTSPELAPPSVMADFNGDNKPDLATLGVLDLNHRDQIRVQFNTVQSPVFTFLIRPAANRLSARDLDGDNDRDLVLETPLRVPLAVWINDGAGNFKPGDLDNFRFLLSHDDTRTLASGERPLVPIRTGECPRRSAVGTQLGTNGLELTDGKVVDGCLESLGASNHFPIWTRGPPA